MADDNGQLDLQNGLVLDGTNVAGMEGTYTVVYTGDIVPDEDTLYLLVIEGVHDVDDPQTKPLDHDLLVIGLKPGEHLPNLAEVLTIEYALETVATGNNFLYVIHGEWVTTDNVPVSIDRGQTWTIVVEEYGEVSCAFAAIVHEETEEYMICLGEAEVNEASVPFVLILERIDPDELSFRSIDPDDSDLWTRITDQFLLMLGIIVDSAEEKEPDDEELEGQEEPDEGGSTYS